MSQCTCTMQALPDGGARLIQCDNCAAMDRDPVNSELDALAKLVHRYRTALQRVNHELGWFGSMICEGPDVMPLRDVITAAQKDLGKVHAIINEALAG